MSRQALFVAGLALALAGCGTENPIGPPSPTLGAVAAVEVLSLANTHKTIGDNVLSAVSGQDCSSVRAAQGGRYCQDRPDADTTPKLTQVTYCYRALGGATCYDRPFLEDADGFNGARIDIVPANAPGPYGKADDPPNGR